jgi:DNA-binding CsgD family transcriptional regulator
MVSKYDAFADEERDYRDEDLMRELYVDKRLSMSEISDRLDCGVATVSRWIDRHGIESRSVSEGNKIAATRTPAHFYTNNRGREMWVDNSHGSFDTVQVARLLAVAEYGFDSVVGNHVHHRDIEGKGRGGTPWLNYADGISIRDPSEHLTDHSVGNTKQEKIDNGDCEQIRKSARSTAELAEKHDVHPRTVKRHRTGECHHVN